MEIKTSTKASSTLIAYNHNGKNIFIDVIKDSIFPQLGNFLIIDGGHDIDSVIQGNYSYPASTKVNVDIGKIKKGIWKPGLIDNLESNLDFSNISKNRAKRDLGILIQKMEDILLNVEPISDGLKAYSHKIRELFILSCTELENALKFYQLGKNENMKDYFQILTLVDLEKYEIRFTGYANIFKSNPFLNWKSVGTLKWYQDYNSTKHDRDNNFHLATLENCLNAIASNIVMYCIRYSPYTLLNENDSYSNLIRNSIEIDFKNYSLDDIYIPMLDGSKTYSGAFYATHHFSNGTEIKEVYDSWMIVPWIKV